MPGGIQRQGWLIEVPDLTLFPDHFGAGTVLFRAGLELAIMRYGLWAFAALRRRLPFPISGLVLQVFKLSADLLSPFGTGTGGMSVTVTVGAERRWWRLLAQNEDGPFIPGIPARALLRRAQLPVGAGPALEAITLAEAEAAMNDLDVRTETGRTLIEPIFPGVLGADFDKLPPKIRATHRTTEQSHWRGTAQIQRGTGLRSRIIGWLFGFPLAGADVPVEVIKTVTARGETWQRSFGGRKFKSHLARTPRGMTERFGLFTFLLDLEVKDGALTYPVAAGRLGPIPLPRAVLPISNACETEQDGRFHFDVKLMLPLGAGLLAHYKGTLSPAVP